MQVTKEDGARPIKNWAIGIEAEAMQQAKNLARLPFIASQGVALMPDAHSGKGSTIGSVIATEKAIIPASVGVDIGCGMNAIRLSLKASDLPDSLLAIRNQIERDIPLGSGGAHSAHDFKRPEFAENISSAFPTLVHKAGWGQASGAYKSALPFFLACSSVP